MASVESVQEKLFSEISDLNMFLGKIMNVPVYSQAAHALATMRVCHLQILLCLFTFNVGALLI
jgi:GTP cyclohydrolase I